MAAGNTYVALATQTLGSAAASVTFSSISGSYTDLVLVNQSGLPSDYAKLTLNADTGSNYSYTSLYGTGSAAGSNRISGDTSILTNWYAYYPSTVGNSVGIINIMNYSNSTTYKTVLCRSNAAVAGVEAIVGLWRSTAAITTVTLTAGSGTFGTGSTFSLYGILAA